VKPIVAGSTARYARQSMLNDRSTILSLLRTRRSARPRDLAGPGPSAEQLDEMLAIASRTPDHGCLTPWRFVTVGTEQRDALAEVLLRALAEDNPGATDAHREKEVKFAH
jgi:nitroreductase